MLAKRNMHPYQNTGVSHIVDHPKSGLFLDMGLGKTVTTLTAVETLMNDFLEISTALIVAPKRVVESVWMQEAEKWSHLNCLTFSLISGNEKQRREAIKKKADIHLISRDNIAWLCGVFGGSFMPWELLILDELSSFKSPKSLRFKALKQVQPCFKRVIGLTGTPAPNGLIDLWSQLYLLDRGERLGKTITAYRKDFFTAGQSNGHIVYSYNLKKGSQEAIYAKIEDICISMKAKDYLDLPERIDNHIKVILPDEVIKQYEDFEKEKIFEVFGSGEEITAMNAAALSNKLMQFANGAVYDENKDYHIIHEAKLEALEDIIEDANGQPVLIAWSFRHDTERILEKLKKHKSVQLKTDKHVTDWNEGKIKVLMMHPASGGHGLNLQAGGNIIVWFGPTWALELYQQLNARLHRQGQKNGVIVNHLIAKGTIDEDIVKSIASKDRTQDSLMEAIKAKIKKYGF